MTRRGQIVLWLIVALFALFNVYTSLVPALVPAGLVGIINTVFLVVFALVHGAALYGLGGIAVFVILCLVVGNIFENTSILTGFPFGHYHYSDVLGAKVFLVPVTIGGAYFGAGYLSWTVACVLLGRTSQPFDRFAQWAIPVVASFLMISWDFMLDPLASTVDHYWIWENGGGFFGVPFTNYLGWLLTVFIFYMLFSAYHRRAVTKSGPLVIRFSTSFWALPIAMYALLSIHYILIYLVPSSNLRVLDAAGHAWMLRDIEETAALVAVFTILAFSIFAALRLADSASKQAKSDLAK
jgi:uncharacterized membrane protein